MFYRNEGMNALVGTDWKEYFDIIIVEARKPRFFTDESRPFRIFDADSSTHLWDRVEHLEKGVIYFEGTVKQMQEMMQWSGHEVCSILVIIRTAIWPMLQWMANGCHYL